MLNTSPNHQRQKINKLFLDTTRQETLLSKNLLTFWVYHRVDLVIINHRLIVKKTIKNSQGFMVR